MNAQRLHSASKRRRQVFREKFILIAAAVIVIACSSVMLGARLVDAHGSQSEITQDYKYYKSIQLNAGDTLWAIAETYTDDESDSISAVTNYIKVLKEINGLTSDTIHEGQYLTVVYNDKNFK